MTLRLRLLFALALTGCDCSGTSLTRLTDVPPGATCPAGGVIIATGRDSNANGKLDDTEVTAHSQVCSGPSPTDGGAVVSLVQTTTVPVGDVNCLQGGVKLEFGLDDGTGGGVAGNGKLEGAEILSTRYICNGGAPYYPGSTTAPASPNGTFKIDASGGPATGGNGGAGGLISVRVRAGTLGGHAKVFKTGVTDATFTVTASPTFTSGSVPVTYSADTTLTSYGSIALGLASGNPSFQVNGDPRLYSNVGGVASVVTSVTVAAGTTLTLSLNGGNAAVVVVRQDIKNAGTITPMLQGGTLNRGALVLRAENYFSDPGSSLFLRGAASVDMTGGTGGNLDIATTLALTSQGSITTTGGEGDDGAPAGSVSLVSGAGELTNTGAIEAKGGLGSVGNGAGGGTVVLRAPFRGVRNSGTIDNSGGQGGNNGGNGGVVSLAPSNVGSVINSGALISRGGICLAADCNGGSGGSVSIDSIGGELRSAGSITTNGADGLGMGNGGNGGGVHLYSRDDGTYAGGGVVVATGSLKISGNIVTRGGGGTNGGVGATVDVVLDTTNIPQGQELELLGYTDLVSNGGASQNAAGGTAGAINLTNAPSRYLSSIAAPGGGAFNHAALSLRGGDGRPGGAGGRVLISTQTQFRFDNSNEFASSLGATVDVRGGAGVNGEGGAAGELAVVGIAAATNASELQAAGGGVSAGNTLSGAGGTFRLTSDYGAATNSGALTLSGGASTGSARGGGRATVRGKSVSTTAAIACNGGNAGGQGGNGGIIDLTTVPTGASMASGTLSVLGGTGANAGAKGSILLDGVDVTP